MAEDTEIAWAHHTANCWHGCVEVCDMCDHCYARMLSARWGHDVWGAHKPRRIIKSFWKDLARFQRLASAAGEYHRVFIGSMMDIFEKPMPLINSKSEVVEGLTTGDLRDRLFKEISAGLYPNLIMLFLTKRPGNIPKYVPAEWLKHPPVNVMYGCSPSTWQDVEKLLQVPGRRFLSLEPLIKRFKLPTKTMRELHEEAAGMNLDSLFFTMNGIDPAEERCVLTGIDWIITGGESGPKARPYHPMWFEEIKAQCAQAGIPFFFKQWGEFLPENQVYDTGMLMDDIRKKSGYTVWPDGNAAVLKAGDIGVHLDRGVRLRRVGKKAAGHLLNGNEYYQFPAYHSMPDLGQSGQSTWYSEQEDKMRQELYLGTWKCES